MANILTVGGGSGGKSPIRIAREEARRESTQDFNFVRKLLYFFELRVPEKTLRTLGPNRFFFPLILNPTSYTLTEPFTVELTPTQGGGLYAEEHGIVMRTIRLRGHTGFKPRSLTRDASVASVVLAVEKKSYTRQLQPFVLDAISGHKHFQYLQDAVFRSYADLKRDPNTAEDTHLIFHNPRDEEDWLVVPRKFELTRTADKRILYEYDIELTVVDKADAVNVTFSEDKSLLDEMRDGIRQAKRYVDMATGFVADVTASLAEIGRFVSDIATVVGSIEELAAATQSFVEGATDLIEKPASILLSLAESIEQISETLSTSVAEVKNIPSAYINSWRRVGDAVHQLGTHPELFESDSQRVLREIKSRQSRVDAARRASTASEPTTIDSFGTRGTEPLPGEENRAEADIVAGRGVNRYTGAQTVRLGQGDTLASLASKYLNDARLWQDIALFNGLKPPFINTQADANLAGPDSPLPGVQSIGQEILIPNFAQPPQALPVLTVLGVSGESPFEERVLGTDFLLEPTNERKDQYDWVIDTDRGSVDFKLIRGIDNLGQALTTRINTDKGSNVMYKRLGLERVIGLGQTNVDLETARFRVIEAIQQDPRVANTRNIRFSVSTDAPDAVEVDVDVTVKGFSDGASIRAIGVGR